MCKINPRVDFAFKLIFGNEQNKDILISLLNAILEDYQTCPIESIEILNPLGSKEYSKDKLTILDIKAKDQKGEFYNIEMQISDQYYYQKRALYYWSRLYTSQISEGIGYQNLTRTVSINILNFNAIKEKDYHNVYRVRELKQNTDLTDHLEIHFIELDKFTKELPDIKRTMDRWIYFLKHAEKFTETNLPEPLKEIKPIEKANVILDRISLNKEQREIYEARLKSLRDADGALQTARIRGLEEGIEKGIEQGKEAGKKEEKIETARKLFKKKFSVEEICEITGLSEDEIKKIK
ncbi:MAG: Rpn family recombination-promoting nuclease/putative transposase [Candidatus Eremiobacterota bacterium]